MEIVGPIQKSEPASIRSLASTNSTLPPQRQTGD
jgi:hypothetical protein